MEFVGVRIVNANRYFQIVFKNYMKGPLLCILTITRRHHSFYYLTV